jgi:nitrile hydratase beta subunit
MNGLHDMGGMTGFGPVEPEADEPVFHGWWEARVFALSQVASRAPSIDAFRHIAENRQPAEYLALPYYGKWLDELKKGLLASGAVTREELAAGRSAQGYLSKARAMSVDEALADCFARHPYERPAAAPARFAAGDKVMTKNINPAGHTRLARYLRHHQGEIVAVHGAHVFPDSNAHGHGEDPHWLYTVEFAARELWGPDADPRDSVTADLWEPYLDAV